MKKLTVFGSAAWILGLLAFIIGLNLQAGTVHSVLVTAGSIIFLAGLFCMGIVWLKRKKDV